VLIAVFAIVKKVICAGKCANFLRCVKIIIDAELEKSDEDYFNWIV
jgi:hypothetical protein